MTIKRQMILAGMTLLVLCGVVAAQPTMARAVRLEDSVVLIRAVSQDFDYTMPWKQSAMSQGSGTGFIISGNRILTNAHNVSNNKYVELKKQDVAKRYPARVVFIGHDCDLAILQVADPSFYDGTVPVEIGDLPKANTTVQTYGFPLGGEHISITEGVVSRIQMDNYSHTGADQHLVIQTDAAINPGNSGGPVFQNGKVVGVAFQGLRQADNIGYMIPTTVIKHFLKDIEDGSYDGFGSLGFMSFPGLHSESYRDYLKVPAGEDGVVVLQAMINSSVEGIFQPGDVITRLDDFDVDNDGNVMMYGLKLHLAEVTEQKQLGDTVELTFYRNGQKHVETATVALNRPVLGYSKEFDKQPEYVVYCGLTFVSLTRNYLESWEGNWLSEIPFTLRYLFYYSRDLNKDKERQEYVVLGEILPDEINAYCGEFKNQPVESVNGEPIWSLKDLHEAIEKSKNEAFCIIRFMGTKKPLILDNQKGTVRHEAVLQQYKVPSDYRVN